MGEDGADRRPEQAASNSPKRKRDPNDVLIEMRQLHDEVVSLLASSNNENNTSTKDDVFFSCSNIEEGMKNEESSSHQEEELDLSKAGRLPNDTYSLLVIAPVHSMAFAVSIAVFIIQIIALVLLLLDFTDGADPNNRLSMPVYVTWPLRVAQLFGVVMAAVSGRDVVDSLFILQNGYDETNLIRVLEDHYAEKEERNEAQNVNGCIRGIIECFSKKVRRRKAIEASVNQNKDQKYEEGESAPTVEIPRQLRLRWFFSIYLRMVQGLYNLACTFILIMRSADVRLVMLSYGAVAFVSNVDQMAFQLLALGFYGKGPIHHCRCKILTTLSSIEDQYRDNWRFGKKVRITSLASTSIFVILLGCWYGLASRQATGQYLTKSIYVQFGAEPSQTLYLYSGVYELKMRSYNFFSTTGAVIYKERTPTGDYSSYFMYCDVEKSWVFFPEKPEQGRREIHPCHQAWLARSSRVNSYNILSTASVEWSVQAKDRRSGLATQSVMWDFRMMVNEECQNSAETYGPLCEFSVRCETLEIPFGTFLEPPDGFQLYGIKPADNGIEWHNYNATLNDVNRTYGIILPKTESYDVLRYPEPGEGLVLVYDRPVYYRKLGTLKNQNGLSVYSIILSSGRYYGRFVIVVPSGTSSRRAINDQEQAVEASLQLYELMARAWQENCGYEGKPQRWMCGYEDIFTLLLRFATHITDKYVLLNPDSDTGNAISMPWNIIDRFVQRRVSGQFSCGDGIGLGRFK